MFSLLDFIETNDGKKYIWCKNHEESKECTAALQAAGKKWKFGGEYSEWDVYERRDGITNVIYSNDGGWDHDEPGFSFVKENGGDIVQWEVLAREAGLKDTVKCVNSDEIDLMFREMEVR